MQGQHFGAGVRHHRWQNHAQADVEHARGHLDLALFLAPDQLLHGRAATATQHLGPGNRTKTRCSLLALPDPGCLHALLGSHVTTEIVVGTCLGHGIGLQPGAAFGAEGGFLGRVLEVHGLAVSRGRALHNRLFRRSKQSFLQLDRHLLAPGVDTAQLHGLLARTAVEQMAIQLPCIAHAAVGVQVFLCSIRQRLSAAHARCGGCAGQLGRTISQSHVCRQRPGSVIAMRTGQLVVGVEIGQLVLDALIGPNGPAKGLALPGVAAGHLQRGVGRSQLFEGQHHGSTIAHACQHLGCAAGSVKLLGRRAVKAQQGIGLGRIQRLELLALHRAVTPEGHQHIRPRLIARQRHTPLRGHAVGHQRTLPLQGLAVKQGQTGWRFLPVRRRCQATNASTRNRQQPLPALRRLLLCR